MQKILKYTWRELRKNIIGRTDLLSCFGIYFLEVSGGKEKRRQ